MNEEQEKLFMNWWDGVKDIPAIYKYEHAQAAWNESAKIHTMLERERCIAICGNQYGFLAEAMRNGSK